MGDDPKKPGRRKKGRGKNRPVDAAVVPTQAFKQMPTEVLDLPPPDPKKLVDPNAATRRTSMQNKVLVDDDEPKPAIPPEFYLDDEASAPAANADSGGEFDDPYGTEVLGAFEPEGLPKPQGLAANVTEPEPFQPPALNSDMRALHEVAREPTAEHPLIDEDNEAEGTDTAADDDHNLFESPTTGFDKVATGESDSPFSEHVRTDEEAVSEEPAPQEPPAPAPREPPQPDPVNAAYYDDNQGAFNSARVYDPQTAANAVLPNDAFAPRASADWPEISLEGPPAAAPPATSGSRKPFALLVVFVAVLFVTIGAMGAAFKLGVIGGAKANKPIWGDLPSGGGASDDAENDGDDPAKGDGAKDDDTDASPDDDADTTAKDPPKPSRDDTWKSALAAAAAPALLGIDPAWKKKSVVVRLARADDRSKSKHKGLDDELALAFGTILKEDDHARWRLKNRVRRQGWTVELVLNDVQIASGTAETVVRARCEAKAEGKRTTPDRLRREVDVEQRIASGTPDAPAEEIARDIAKACGYRLAWDFVASALP